MSSEETSKILVCKGCKADLTKEAHKEDCSIFANEKAEHAANEAAQQKIIADALAEKAIKDARIAVEKKNEDEIQKIKEKMEKADTEEKQNRLKLTVISKIKKLAPNEDIDALHLETCTLEKLAEIHAQVLAEVKREASLNYRVTCPVCHKELGKTETIEQAQAMQQDHKKKEHHSKGGWIVTALIFGILAGLGVAGYRAYQKKKVKDSETK